MTNKPPIDFTKVEALRKHMRLTKGDVADLLGVSRMAYHGWTQGAAIRPANAEAVRKLLRQLLHLMQHEGWPTAEVIAAPRKIRRQKYFEVLGQSQ